MFRLIVKNPLRNKRRGFLTWSGVAVSLFLVSSLAVVYSAMGETYRGADVSPHRMVRRSVGLTLPLPERYGNRIRRVPDLKACTTMLWVGGWWKEPQNTFVAFSMDPEEVFKVVDVPRNAVDHLAAFRRERTAAVAGLPEHYHHPLIQRYWGDLGCGEITKNLGLTRANVATLILCAKQGLRHALALKGVVILPPDGMGVGIHALKSRGGTFVLIFCSGDVLIAGKRIRECRSGAVERKPPVRTPALYDGGEDAATT